MDNVNDDIRRSTDADGMDSTAVRDLEDNIRNITYRHDAGEGMRMEDDIVYEDDETPETSVDKPQAFSNDEIREARMIRNQEQADTIDDTIADLKETLSNIESGQDYSRMPTSDKLKKIKEDYVDNINGKLRPIIDAHKGRLEEDQVSAMKDRDRERPAVIRFADYVGQKIGLRKKKVYSANVTLEDTVESYKNIEIGSAKEVLRELNRDIIELKEKYENASNDLKTKIDGKNKLVDKYAVGLMKLEALEEVVTENVQARDKYLKVSSKPGYDGEYGPLIEDLNIRIKDIEDKRTELLKMMEKYKNAVHRLGQDIESEEEIVNYLKASHVTIHDQYAYLKRQVNITSNPNTMEDQTDVVTRAMQKISMLKAGNLGVFMKETDVAVSRYLTAMSQENQNTPKLQASNAADEILKPREVRLDDYMAQQLMARHGHMKA